MQIISTQVSFIEHLLAIPKTRNPNRDEIYAMRLDVQPRPIEILKSANNYFTDKMAKEKQLFATNYIAF